MKKIKNISIVSVLISTLVLLSCNKDTVSPPIKILSEDEIITIDSLRNMYTAVDVLINYDLSVYGTITADEVSGNLYKTLFLQDGTNAIQLNLTSSSQVYEGDRVRISLRGTTITRDNNMLVVDNIDPDRQIIKQGTNESIAPELVSISDILIPSGSIYSPYQGKLIQINDVEFICNDIWSTWANAITQYDENRTLIDSINKTVIVRSSGYSTFANQTLPKGKGSIIAVVTQYNGTVQLAIRTPQELTMSGTRNNECPYYVKNFEDQNITSGGWIMENIIGNIDWTTNNLGSNSTYYAQITNYNSGNTACETWLISPEFDLTGITNPTLSFQSAYNYSGDPLKLYVTTSFTGDVTTTTWADMTSLATWSGGGWSWANSGLINLSAYTTSGVRFAFKYTGSNSSGSTWEIDDFTIED
ncbi:MAG: choice-of-anchor J domain-containing protein [Flavobacteriales bacterium]|nr:choice-of-anchor J domain-containing protein [Flavobacteriales bacterium]MCB9363658.1 choice-of-anchor J domain-containing protein [Flavobacteriales bacterium]